MDRRSGGSSTSSTHCSSGRVTEYREALPLKKEEALLSEMRAGGECLLDAVIQILKVASGRGSGGNEGKCTHQDVLLWSRGHRGGGAKTHLPSSASLCWVSHSLLALPFASLPSHRTYADGNLCRSFEESFLTPGQLVPFCFRRRH
ncbi:hypothetical protein Celaphus_00006426 [Cervus elaphus hippelaphus]|uniref:Uncharacterized protein n=1 Tax=Cervus elaphus hippelaphus TaxID=46360 RepID=A0A212CU08_CEREH|nr:hypothetical protein Celaphus_00006426 [Cervus elaphus hippelaphus]